MNAVKALIGETWRAARKRLLRDSELLSNVGALSTGTFFSSVLGFVYWIFALRLFPVEVVGIVAAAIALSSFVGLLGDFGFGTMLLGETHQTEEDASRLISASLFSSAFCGSLVGLVSLAIVHATGMHFGNVVGDWPHDVLFVLACALASFSLTLDQAFVGMLKARQQMLRNLVVSVLKIVLLVPLVFVPQNSNLAILIFNSWILASLISVILVLATSGTITLSAWIRPNFVQLLRRQREVISHHLLNITVQTPRLVMPIVVASQIGAAANGAFYPALMIANIILLVPAALTTVLFASGSKTPELFVSQLHTTLAISVAGSALSIMGFYLFGPFALSLISPESSRVMTPSFRWFGFLIAGLTIKMHFIAISRVRDRMFAVSGIIGLLSFFEVIAAWLGARIGGMQGLIFGWLVVVLIGAAVLYPTIERERRGRG